MSTIDGYIFSDGRITRGHAVVTDGEVELSDGALKGVPDTRGVIIPRMINAHTHCADVGVKVEPGMSLEELVAPPDGLKHRYLRETPRETLVADMAGFERDSLRNGIGCFIDFREGGYEGCMMAREACVTGIILGRPISQEYDEQEVEMILSVSDGIALPSISDVDRRYAEKVAEQVHRAGKMFSIHCSERIREDIDTVLSLSPDFVVHMVEATDPDLRRCADEDVPIAVCPRSNRFFGKVTPLGRMMDAGNTVAAGTDNAMLCPPDLRPEMLLFREILGDRGDSAEWMWKCLAENPRKLLYRTRGIVAHNKMERTYSVLPFEGQAPENAWSHSGPVGSI